MTEAALMARPPKKPKRDPYAPAVPTQWDRGADGPANRVNMRAEPATDIDPETGRETPNPNNVKRYRRMDWVEVYERKGELTAVQVAAARKLQMAAEGLRERDPLAAIGEPRVRTASGNAAANRIDARRYFRELWGFIPRASRPVIERVVIDGLPISASRNMALRERQFERLRIGLDAVVGI